MGRLTLNILLSFAQFEREVTAERIRDKVAASRKKGMWMGGVPPYGYRVENRKLVVDEEHAEYVRWIFDRFLEIGSCTELAREVGTRGLRTPRGNRIDKKYIYRMLSNRAYIGEAVHKGDSYPGEHDAIIDPEIWDRVHAILQESPRKRAARTADAAAEERSAGWVCWRGNADGLGGFTYVNRLSVVTLQATGMGFFGLYGSTAALATTLTLSAVVSCIGIGFQRGTHTNWQLFQNDASGAPTLTDLGASFPVASTTNVLTLTLLAAPNSGEIGVRVVEEVSGAVVEAMLDTDIPAATQLLSPRNYMNNGATAAAVAYDCLGVYVETDY